MPNSWMYLLLRNPVSTFSEMANSWMYSLLRNLASTFQKRLVKQSISKTEVDISPSSKLWKLFKFTRHPAFFYFIVIVIILDMINVGFAIAGQFVDHFFFNRTIFRSVNLGFLCVYIVEMVLKVNTEFDTMICWCLSVPVCALLV